MNQHRRTGARRRPPVAPRSSRAPVMVACSHPVNKRVGDPRGHPSCPATPPPALGPSPVAVPGSIPHPRMGESPGPTLFVLVTWGCTKSQGGTVTWVPTPPWVPALPWVLLLPRVPTPPRVPSFPRVPTFTRCPSHPWCPPFPGCPHFPGCPPIWVPTPTSLPTIPWTPTLP